MTIADVTENNILKLIFNATSWANVAQDGASPITNISMALHTADPGDTGNQLSSESAYPNYTRKDQARTTGGWSASTAGATALQTNVDYPTSGAGAAGNITHFSAGKTGGGGTDIFWSGAVTPNIVIGSAGGVIPRLNSGSTITLD